jgi:flagellar assembly protein FliH
LAQTQVSSRDAAALHIDLFEYQATPPGAERPAWPGWDEPEDSAAADAGVAQADSEARHKAEFEQRLAEEARRAFDAGRERGRLEGRAVEQETQAASIEAGRERQVRQTAELVESFVEERDRYLLKVEHAVVELALAIAARILRREAQMDPLLLTGAVRVALGQLSSSTGVRLKVPPLELDLWEEAITLMPKLALKPTVIAGEGMRLGDCRVEAELGSVDLGIRAQLAEIERGFFDRVGGQRVGTGSEASMHSAPAASRAAPFSHSATSYSAARPVAEQDSDLNAELLTEARP